MMFYLHRILNVGFVFSSLAITVYQGVAGMVLLSESTIKLSSVYHPVLYTASTVAIRVSECKAENFDYTERTVSSFSTEPEFALQQCPPRLGEHGSRAAQVR